MAERDMEIVIRAKDEISGPMESAGRRTRSAIDDVSASIERLGASKVLERFSTASGSRLSGLSRAFAELKETIEGIPRISPFEETDQFDDEGRIQRLRSYHALYLDEKARVEFEERAATESHLRQTDEMERASWDARLSYAQAGSAVISNTLQNLFVATGSRHRSAFEAMKAFAVAETVIQTYRAAQGAYAALAPIPVVGPALGAAAAAAAIASGLARVEQIRDTEPGGATASISASGRANPSYSGGSSSAYPVPTSLEGESSQSITIHIYNPLSEQNWQQIVEDNIIPAMKDAGERNISVNIKNI